MLLDTFRHSAMGITEVEADSFYLATSLVVEYQTAILAGRPYVSPASFLHRLDLRGWASGEPVKPEATLQFPEPARGLNGSCLIAPGVVLVADCFAGLVWRVDLPADGRQAAARVWLRHDSMAHDPDGPMPDQPGINGPAPRPSRAAAARSGRGEAGPGLALGVIPLTAG